MARQPVAQPRYDDDEPFSRLFESFAKLVLYAGAGATLVGLAFLIYTYMVFAGGGPPGAADQAIVNCATFGKILLGGVCAVGLASAYMFWGEEVLGPIMILGAAALVASPWYLPSMVGQDIPTPASAAALREIVFTGWIFACLAMVVVVLDLTWRLRLRVRQGSKAEQLKYGKGIKEEREIRNVFMGKCWQLPFCRKFVREKCPIYHARRTCWKERVGCMCEESVIANAMSGQLIPKDQLGASKMIPYNRDLPMAAKIERCRQCVIYNEHQKHKYKLALPAVIAFLVGVYLLGREPLLAMVQGGVKSVDRMIGQATYRDATGGGTLVQQAKESPIPFQEILLVCLLFVVFAYLMRVVEYLFFKLKV